MKKRFSEEQIIGILREGEADGAVIRDICRKHNITEQTSNWGPGSGAVALTYAFLVQPGQIMSGRMISCMIVWLKIRTLTILPGMPKPKDINQMEIR